MTVTSSTTTATFTVNQPKDTVGQFDNVWKHVYTITVQPNGTFTGTGSVTANGAGEVVWTETITGQFTDSDDDDTVSDHVTFNTAPNAGATFSVTNAPMDSTTVPRRVHLGGQRHPVPDRSAGVQDRHRATA